MTRLHADTVVYIHVHERRSTGGGHGVANHGVLAGVAVAVSVLLVCGCCALIRGGVCSGNRDASQWEQRGPGQGGSIAEAHMLRLRSDFLEKQIQVRQSGLGSSGRVSGLLGGTGLSITLS